MENNSKLPAFPIKGYAEGVTKREYFAGLAMQALISNHNIARPNHEADAFEAQRARFSDVAIQYADSLLKQLEIIK